MVTEVLILLLLIALLRKLMFKSRADHLLNKIPGPRAYPVIGNMLDFKYPQEDVAVTMQKMAQQYGPVYVLWLGTDPVVCLTDPEDVESVLTNRKITDKPEAFKVFHPWIKQGLFTSGGEEWRKQRKIVAPAFYPSILQSYIQVFEKNSDNLVKEFESNSGKDFDVTPIVAQYSFDVIIDTAMKLNNIREKPKILKAMDELTYIIAHRGFSLLQSTFLFPLLPVGRQHDSLVSFLHGVTENIIQERKIKLSENTQGEEKEDSDIGMKEKKPFLDLLLQFNCDGAGMSDLDIRMQVDTFMAAGYDTTQSAVSFALYCLSQHPDVQDLVYDEIQHILGESEREATYQDLQDMRYLENVLKESLRLYSTTRIVGRKTGHEIQLKSGYTIPKDCSVFVLAYAMHVDPRLHPQPLQFLPQRFQTKDMHPYSHLPFGGGPRECIGKKFAMLSMKSVVTQVLRKFKLLPSDIPLEPWFDIILRSSNGIHLRVEPRLQRVHVNRKATQ